ncbi:Hypothetical protein ABZS17D1_00781 [Kosakonia cowanii]
MQHRRGFGQVAGGHHGMKNFDMAQVNSGHKVIQLQKVIHIIFA